MRRSDILEQSDCYQEQSGDKLAKRWERAVTSAVLRMVETPGARALHIRSIAHGNAAPPGPTSASRLFAPQTSSLSSRSREFLSVNPKPSLLISGPLKRRRQFINLLASYRSDAEKLRRESIHHLTLSVLRIRQITYSEGCAAG